MPSQSSHNYKSYRRTQRKLVNENIYTGGMQYSENPLDPGVARTMVNMIQKDYGKRVRPRGGLRLLSEPASLGVHLPNAYVHHSGTMFISNTATGETYLRRYALILDEVAPSTWGSTATSKVVVEEPQELSSIGNLKVSTLAQGATDYQVKHNTRKELTQIHGVPINKVSPEGVHASIEGNTYLITQSGLARLVVEYDGTDYTHKLELVTPLEVTPTQAVNYGYNMLLENPYAFPNSAGGNFMPEGILPYETNGTKIKLQAKVGEPVRFKLIYQYVQDEQYKVQWEVQDIQVADTPRVIQSKEASPIYTNGEDIFVDYNSPFKQFSVIASIYKANDLETPIRVMLLAAYHLSDEAKQKQEQKDYDLITAQDVCVWKNQMVYWGVYGAEMSIFISDVNDPTYVPFPNSTIIFNEKVLKAFPYMEHLVVVTENSIFQVSFNPEGGFISKRVQANLQLREDDTSAMYGIRNLICFKNDNYYYMVVPNIKNDKGELQIAPISENIHDLLDNFNSFMRRILSSVYTLRQLFSVREQDIEVSLQDYYSRSGGHIIKHTYKLKLTALTEVHFLDLNVVYDTIARVWTLEIVESTQRPLAPFQSMATGHMQLLSVYDKGGVTYVQRLGTDEEDPEDDFNLDNGKLRKFENHQLYDTGKRNIDGFKKKRLRHIILEFNNLSNEDLQFNHNIYLDDDTRSDLYKYETIHITDPEALNYGQVYVERQFVDPTMVHGTTKLGTWALGNSQFPNQSILKIHLEASGKGYYPRLQLITRSSKLYELNQITWVYRDMSAR